MISEVQTILKDTNKKRFDHLFTLTFFVFFVLFNWEVILAFTGVGESLSTRIEFIRNLQLGLMDYLKPLIAAFLYLMINPKLQSFIENYHLKITAENQQKKDLVALQTDEESQALFGKCSDIGLAGKNVIDETLIYGTAQENFLKKTALSASEIISTREDLCQRYQDSFKKIQELMIVLAMQNQNKVVAMHQRLKDEKRI